MKGSRVSRLIRHGIENSIDEVGRLLYSGKLLRSKEKIGLRNSIKFLIRNEKTEEIFKILHRAIHKRSRRDSGYGSNFENEDQHSLCELEYESDSDSAKETEQCSINKTIKIIIQTLINAGVNIGTYKYETVETPLHWASSAGNTNLVKFLIEKGVDVDIKNKRGATALHIAIINGHLDVVKKLIKLGRARINITDSQGQTPLQLAVSCENEDIVEYLLKKNANLSTTCPFVDRSTEDIGELGDNLYIQAKELEGTKYTPLQLAAFLGNLDIIKLLITYRADVNAICKNKGYSCLHMAVFGITYYVDREIREELEVLNFLLSKSSSLINTQDHEYNSPLHLAVSANHEETIRVLLKNGALLSKFRRGGHTPFHDAVSTGSLDLVKLLLENSNEKAKLINCVFIPVEENGDDTCLQPSPLHVAINAYIDFLKRKEDSLESFNIIQYLLSYPTLDINIKDFYGETPLHYAIKYIEDDELALTLINELLAAKNINPFIKDQTGKTPFDYAIASNRAEILQKLIHHKYYDDNSLLHLAAENGDNKAVRYLIKKGIDVHSTNNSSNTPLHIAAKNGNLSIVKLLVRLGAKINAPNRNGESAIHLAIDEYINLLNEKTTQYLDVIRYLASINAKLDIQNTLRRTALHDATEYGNSVLLNTLLTNSWNIDLFIRDDKEKTPIDYCTEKKNYSRSTLDQYAKIQADRNTSIENYNAKKYVVSAIALCVVNAIFIGLYINQYPVESFISDTQCLGLMFITNIAALSCCLIINKCVERSIETKHKNKVLGLFSVENNDEVSPALQETNLATLSSQKENAL